MSDLKIRRCFYIHGEKIIDTPDGEFLVTPRCNDKLKIFDYLENKDFPFFLPMRNSSSDSYEVYPYIVDSMEPSDKAVDLIHVLSLLHIKTTSYREVQMDSIKEIYETTLQKIDSLKEYYYQLQDVIEEHIYMAPDEYLLIRNISLLYENLNLSREYLNEWYESKKDEKKERVVFLHRQPSLSNFIDFKTPYFIHWDLSEKGYPIYDFLYFYRCHYLELEMDSLFQVYQSKFLFTSDEKALFLCLLLLDEKIDLSDNHYQNTILVHHRILYSAKARDFVLKQNQEYQEANENKFY